MQIVAEEGGYELCCVERKWTKIAIRLGYAMGKSVGSTLRHHYEKVLYPYDVFQKGVNIKDAEVNNKENDSLYSPLCNSRIR